MKPLEGVVILVVEDEEMLREVLKDFFTGLGASVHEAPNGIFGLCRAKELQPSIVITDVRMPGGDGITMAREISKLPPPRPPVFIYSGYNSMIPENWREIGVLGVYEKPLPLDEMLVAIQAELTARSISGE